MCGRNIPNVTVLKRAMLACDLANAYRFALHLLITSFLFLLEF